MKQIIFATGNEGKMKEIREILSGLDVKVLSLKEAGIEADIVEDGTTFEENAQIKATEIQKLVQKFIKEEHVADTDKPLYSIDKELETVVLADDSGLEVDYLNKEPGIYSARYAGEDTPYSIKNQMIIDRLEGVPDEKRTARFVCAMAAAFADGSVKTCRGTIEGRIGYEPQGENGFGYDPIFYVPEYDCTTAQLSMEQKNELSHRGKALREIAKYL